MKKILIIAISVLLIFTMSSCNNSKITMEEAIDIATSHAKLKTVDVDVNSSIIENNLYKVDFSYNNIQYLYDIDLNTGKIIGFSTTPINSANTDEQKKDSALETSTTESSSPPPAPSSSEIGATEITLEKAKEIALNHAKLTEQDVVFIKAKKDFDNNKWEYDIEFYHNNIEYDYDIDATTGEILSFDQDIENYAVDTNQGKNLISQDEAKNIATTHAKLNIADVSFKKIEIDHDNNILIYEVEFYHNNIEYEYEINASTGDIMSFDVD